MFQNDGDKVWGLGIADDRHAMSAILHSLAILKAMDFRDYGTITVLINPDEEINSPASRNPSTWTSSTALSPSSRRLSHHSSA